MNPKYAKILLILIVLAGVGVMSYLTYLHYSPESQSFCDLGGNLNCSLVNKSEFSEVFGIPVSIGGLVYFLIVGAAVLFRYNENTLRMLVFWTIVALGPAIYLTIVELFFIESICLFCESAKVLMFAVLGVAWWALGVKKLPINTLVAPLVIAVLLAGATFFVHANQGPGDANSEFAQCLTEKGFLMYGSATCQFCAKQRAMFGEESFEHIREIECDPRNPNHEVELCIEKNIEHTPTWMQENVDGDTLHRFEAGVQELEKLAAVSGCQLPDNN